MKNSDRLISEIAEKAQAVQHETHREAYSEIVDGTVLVVGNTAYLITVGRVLYVARSGNGFRYVGAAGDKIPSNCPQAVIDVWLGGTGRA